MTKINTETLNKDHHHETHLENKADEDSLQHNHDEHDHHNHSDQEHDKHSH